MKVTWSSFWNLLVPLPDWYRVVGVQVSTCVWDFCGQPMVSRRLRWSRQTCFCARVLLSGSHLEHLSVPLQIFSPPCSVLWEMTSMGCVGWTLAVWFWLALANGAWAGPGRASSLSWSVLPALLCISWVGHSYSGARSASQLQLQILLGLVTPYLSP